MLINFNIPIHNFMFITFPLFEKNNFEIEWKNLPNKSKKKWKITNRSKIEDVKILFKNYFTLEIQVKKKYSGKMILELFSQKEIFYQIDYNVIKKEVKLIFRYLHSDKNELEVFFMQIFDNIEKILL